MAGDYPDSWLPIQAELATVFSKMRECLRPDGEKLLNRYWPRSGVDQAAPSAFVIFSARLFQNQEAAVLPAFFLMLVHLAMTFHNISPQIRGRDRQLVILEGDYLYASLFYQLYKNECLFLLQRLAQLIMEMNEGSVMQRLQEPEARSTGAAPLPRVRQAGTRQYLSEHDPLIVEILTKRYGRFFAECGELGGYFAGRQGHEIAMLGQLGMKFGIAYGAKNAGFKPELGLAAMEQSLKILKQIPDVVDRDEMEFFIRELLKAPHRAPPERTTG